MKVCTFQHVASEGWKNLPQNLNSWDSPQTLIVAFCSPHYRDNPDPVAELQKMFPNSIVSGCSTSGEILNDQISDLTMSVSVVKFDSATVKLATHEIQDANSSRAVGEQLCRHLVGPDLKGIIVFSDGLKANGSALIKGFNSQIDETKTSISGGLAGDGNNFQNTWIIKDGKPTSGWVSAIGLYGKDLVFSAASKGGWDLFGPERTITRSEGNILYEVDGRPALELYKEYLGDRADGLPSTALLFPLQIRCDAKDDKKLVRTVLSIDEENQSLVFAGDVPQGYCAQFMRANFDRVIDGAEQAGSDIIGRLKNRYGTDLIHRSQQDMLNIAITCVGRRLVLGERCEEEVEALRDALGEQSNVVGFYSYGELASHMEGKPCDLHNQSMTVMSILEIAEEAQKQAA